MQENFLHYLFEQKLIKNTEFEIISSGQKNLDAGPDFFNAKIKIDDTIWAGNVEIHINASDWIKHKHNKDKAYDNIILHLVFNNDVELFSTHGTLIPTFKILFDQQLLENYEALLSSKTWVHCQEKLFKVDLFTKINYTESLAIERLERKSLYFEQLLAFNQNDWENAFFQAIAKGFGSRLNQVAFELLAKSLPLKILLKHKTSLRQIEALLFGQAGFLNQGIVEDNYFNDLKKEYLFLQKKYNLEPIRFELWKFSKIRPYNFPSIKIALFSQYLYQNQAYLSSISECKSIQEVQDIFNVKASSYWDNHYNFGKKSKALNKSMSAHSIEHLLINTIIPFLFMYTSKMQLSHLQEQYLEWLMQITAEKNNITKEWEKLGFENKNALQSQGLIELKNEKCSKHQCIDCRIGHQILTLLWND